MYPFAEFLLHSRDAVNDVTQIVNVYMWTSGVRFVRTVDIKFTDKLPTFFIIKSWSLLEVVVNLFTRIWFWIRKFTFLGQIFGEIAALTRMWRTLFCHLQRLCQCILLCVSVHLVLQATRVLMHLTLKMYSSTFSGIQEVKLTHHHAKMILIFQHQIAEPPKLIWTNKHGRTGTTHSPTQGSSILEGSIDICQCILDSHPCIRRSTQHGTVRWEQHSYLVLMYDVPVWFSACPLIHVYWPSDPSLRCACGGRAVRPQMVYANDDTSLIDKIKFRRNRYPWAHPMWFIKWSSTWWPMHLWPGLPKLTAFSMDMWSVVVDKSPGPEMFKKKIIDSGALVR